MLCIHCEQPTESSERCDQCGEDPRVHGRYEVIEILGRGATATTYRARDLDSEDEDEVALKELLVRNADSFKTLELFEREAKILEQLDHPAIPRYIDDFTVELGPNVGMYLVQEFVDGEPLSEQLGEERLSRRVALHSVRGVAEILDYLHRRSPPVVHRDIKPQNIMRRPGGTIALIDFGSVQDAVGGSEGGVPTMAGTVGYMAPEQLLGHAEPGSDIYALGATAAALLSGLPAAEALADPKSWSDDVPDEVPQLINAMLASRASNRPNASALLRRLDEVADAFETTALATTRRDEIEARYAQTPRNLPSDFQHPAENLGVLIGGFVTLGLFFSLAVGASAGWLAAAFGTAMTGAVGGVAWWYYSESHRRAKFYREGGVAVGTIAGAIGAPMVEVHYSYQAGGETHRGKFVVPPEATQELSKRQYDRLAEGEPIIVIYDAQKPSRHKPLASLLTTFRMT